jgi:DNA (cytosine-5)-methyltransferase 1
MARDVKRALDLFCAAGGASMGLHLAGFDVCGVDVEEQPEYPFTFARADVLTLTSAYLSQFDLLWASPPCQQFTAYRRKNRASIGHRAPNLIPAVRALLRASGRPYIIENVPGAPLESPVTLCGSMFGLDVRRHRCFETSFPVEAPPCRHELQHGDFPQATNRANRRRTVEVGVWRIPLDVQRRAMGIDWMSLSRLSQAIPPAYAEWLARASGVEASP